MSIARSKGLPGLAGWLWTAWVGVLIAWTFALETPYPVEIKQQLLPSDEGFVFPLSKMLHVAAYAFLTGTAAFLPGRSGRWLPLLVLSLHGFATEFCQNYVPLRTGCLTDVAIDHAGIVLGLLLSLKWWLARR